ncbi:hypothetical protein DSM112329_00199 [Paraconexibacter sp. AEG42_29]|uniref:DUF721 domain-containing protein n=1 Tax=Paraconexibacter sp. AEG42_29 TaxID=2997339 RepID=A0AAU7AP59_9ACTN
MTSTVVGPVLEARLRTILDELGPYPHARVELARVSERPTPATPTAPDPARPADAPPDQRKKGRLLKVSCPACGYPARVTRVWLTKVGPPICPCNSQPMVITDQSPVAKAFKEESEPT